MLSMELGLCMLAVEHTVAWATVCTDQNEIWQGTVYHGYTLATQIWLQIAVFGGFHAVRNKFRQLVPLQVPLRSTENVLVSPK